LTGRCMAGGLMGSWERRFEPAGTVGDLTVSKPAVAGACRAARLLGLEAGPVRPIGRGEAHDLEHFAHLRRLHEPVPARVQRLAMVRRRRGERLGARVDTERAKPGSLRYGTKPAAPPRLGHSSA